MANYPDIPAVVSRAWSDGYKACLADMKQVVNRADMATERYDHIVRFLGV